MNRLAGGRRSFDKWEGSIAVEGRCAVRGVRGEQRAGPPIGEVGLATGEDGTETRVGQDACDSVSVITLNLDQSFFYGASSTTSLLHFLRQPLFLGLTDPDKSCDYCHYLPSPVRSRTTDIHPPTISFCCG